MTEGPNCCKDLPTMSGDCAVFGSSGNFYNLFEMFCCLIDSNETALINLGAL